MIESKNQLKEYLYQDKLSLGISRKRPKLFGDEIWKYEILLRKIEFLLNSKTNFFQKIHYAFLKLAFHRLSIKLGIFIGFNVFDKGLSIAHSGTIIVGNAKVGKNCRIHEGVCIGATNGSDKYPVIGDNCFIATGAKIIGDISLGNNIAIGANAVVVKSFNEDDVTLGGVPAKVISNNNSFNNLSSLLKENDLL